MSFLHQSQEKKQPLKTQSALIAGCGRMGGTLAIALSKKGYDVTVIDPEPSAFRKLSPAFSGFQVTGDATDIDLLERAGIKTADLFMATADRDNINTMIGQIANIIYGIDKVFIRLYDPDKQKVLEGTTIQAIFPSMLSIREFEKLSNICILEEK